MSESAAVQSDVDVSLSLVARRRATMGVRERVVLAAAVDMTLLGLLVAIVTRTHGGPGSVGMLVTLLVATWIVAGQFADLYRPAQMASRSATLSAIARTAAVASIVLLFTFLIWPYSMSRGDVILLAVGGPIVIGIWRLYYIRVSRSQYFERRVLVIGAGASGVALLLALQEHRGHGLRAIGVIDDHPAKLGFQVAGCRVLGDSAAIQQLVTTHNVQEVILTVSGPIGEPLQEALVGCYERGVVVSLMPHVYEQVAEQVPVEYMCRRWIGAVSLRPAGGLTYEAVKRGIDLSASVIGLLIASPIMVATAVLVRLSSPGPIFFRQVRVGLDGRPFTVLKFRTMYLGVGGLAVTVIGRRLRRAHLDELPQLFNVLRADMSLVGPRPKSEAQARTLEREIPLYRVRQRIRPGLTGLAQIKFRYAHDPNDEMLKLRYDLYYLKHRSLLMDISIMVRTVAHVVGMKGY